MAWMVGTALAVLGAALASAVMVRSLLAAAARRSLSLRQGDPSLGPDPVDPYLARLARLTAG